VLSYCLPDLCFYACRDERYWYSVASVLRKGCAMARAYRDGKYYRERAEECRAIAGILTTVDLRDKMLRIATDYERLAEAADKYNNETADALHLRTLR
jgi:hypothetical protein